MLFSVTGLSVLAAALSVSAAPAKRAESPLSVAFTAPNSVSSVDELKIVAAVTNNGANTVKVLKYNSVLDTSATASFKVKAGDQLARFTGIRVQIASESLGEDAYTTIAPGETVTAEHSVGALYDFSALGTGAFTFEPAQTFHYVEAESAPASISSLTSTAVPATPVTVEVQDDVAFRELVSVEKRAKVSCTSSSQAAQISASYTEGKALAAIARDYIDSAGRSSIFISYFGSSAVTRPRAVLNAVATENSSSRVLSCSDPAGACSNGVIAYTITSTTNIYFCSYFYSEVATTALCSGTTVASRNVRGGTTLHELTHAVAGTDDYGYGVSFDQNLAKTNPSEAVNNADNYNTFATQVYASTKC